MKVTYLGHAGWHVKAGDQTIIMDPWLGTGGAFMRSWHQWPQNCFLADWIARTEPGNVALYISHHHQDHFDREFLSRMDKRIPVITGRYIRKHLRDDLRALGFTVSEMENGESLTAGDMKLTLFVDDSYVNEDSGILVECEGAKFLNLNDCRAYDAMDLESMRGVDLFTMQFSSANWYPTTYEYPYDVMEMKAKERRERKFRNVADVIRRLDPKLYVPSAGPAIFLDPALAHHNNAEAFPSWGFFMSWCPSKASDIDPGDFIYLEEGWSPDVRNCRASDYTHPDQYREEREEWEYTLQPYTMLDPFPALEADLREKVRCLKQGIPGTPQIGFEVEGKRLLVDIWSRTVEQVTEFPETDIYTFEFDANTLAYFYWSGESWENLMHSLRFTVQRRPDVFDSHVIQFMRLDAIDLTAYPRAKREGRCVLEGFEIDRYCPHMGADLSRAQVKDGKVICPKHGWEFDLGADGSCTSTNMTINARPTDE